MTASYSCSLLRIPRLCTRSRMASPSGLMDDAARFGIADTSLKDMVTFILALPIKLRREHAFVRRSNEGLPERFQELQRSLRTMGVELTENIIQQEDWCFTASFAQIMKLGHFERDEDG